MKNKTFIVALLALFAFTSCKKTIGDIINNSLDKSNGLNKYSTYLIKQGQQSSTLSSYQRTEYEELRLAVIFDSTAIYNTANPGNQADVNKLFGFSDNNMEHHQYSARFGWNWGKQGLGLYAYTYNNSEREIRYITTVKLGAENICTIKVSGSNYIFTVNQTSVTMPRHSTGAKAVGYKLYPFFGGTEIAPHDIRIFIKEF